MPEGHKSIKSGTHKAMQDISSTFWSYLLFYRQRWFIQHCKYIRTVWDNSSLKFFFLNTIYKQHSIWYAPLMDAAEYSQHCSHWFDSFAGRYPVHPCHTDVLWDSSLKCISVCSISCPLADQSCEEEARHTLPRLIQPCAGSEYGSWRALCKFSYFKSLYHYTLNLLENHYC